VQHSAGEPPEAPAPGGLQEAQGLDSQLSVAEHRDGGPPQSGVDAHPDFARSPTDNPAGPDHADAAKFEASADQQAASFSELQGITTKVDVVEYVESDAGEGPAAALVAGPHQTQGLADGQSQDGSPEWDKAQEFVPGKAMQTDHNFETPQGAAGSDSSAYIRMAQPHAGGGEDSNGLWQINADAASTDPAAAFQPSFQVACS
jgi:hypothetical protein